jgi:NADP-dependent 3-hydroxy acid dehydrogenase YdfG
MLFTGALTGIGCAVAFAKKSAREVVAGRRDEAGTALVRELRSRFGGQVHQHRRPHCLGQFVGLAN